MMKSEMAKPCPKCNKYYPGDCYEDGCKWDLCLCDGCQVHFSRGFSIEDGDEESHPQDECICVQDENNPNCPWCF